MTARSLTAVLLVLALCRAASAQSAIAPDLLWQPGPLKPTDSQLAVKVGDKAPGFDLPGIDGKRVALSQYLGV